jgi:hypothetical protein
MGRLGELAIVREGAEKGRKKAPQEALEKERREGKRSECD